LWGVCFRNAVIFAAGVALVISFRQVPRIEAQQDQSDEKTTASQLRAIVGENFHIRLTEHFMVAYDGTYEDLRLPVGRLEGTYLAVVRFARACGITPKAVAGKLAIIFYDRFDDYARYARKMKMDPNRVAGFYHSANNIAAFVNAVHSPDIKPINDAIVDAERTLRDLAQRGHANDPRQDAIFLQQEIATWRSERDQIVERYNRFVLQHEAAHQVLFNVGVHRHHSNNPQWLIEGLACQFEVSQTGPEGKLIRVNQARLGDLRDALAVPVTRLNPGDRLRKEKLIPLVKLLTDDGLFVDTTQDHTTLYAQSWALVFYLHRNFPDAFAQFLRDGSQQGQGKTKAAFDLEHFTTAFGKPDQKFLENFLAWTLKLRFDPTATER